MSAPAANHSVTVSGLASTTTQATLEHFFSFCGKIASVAQEGTTAKVSFIKESAAKTALMLNGGTLDGSTISVTSEDVEAPALANVKPVESTAQTPSEKEGHDVEQEDKPRSAVLAEYLAHGYTFSDDIIEKSIAADKQYGISSRFLSFFNPLATKVSTAAQPHVERASEKLAQVDEKQGLSLKANAAAIIGAKYYQAALSSTVGSKVHAFYTNTSKQVLDVHEEALRIKESKKAAASPTPASADTTAPAPIPTDAAGAESANAPIPSTGLAADGKPTGTTTA
ncbi:hypothetical protein BCR35DRAFT_281487 [Leucosporidium creatinivorum]|uniref:RRM domain-containing protein n=1 Tax=Leucosporidium creatinivorum TaxID=106004 RepID=A0A1Y2EQQ2_9BASI|nr:hypothetical protein BCR35DRAFT_281487 [Leucosporidium creatinivorum]